MANPSHTGWASLRKASQESEPPPSKLVPFGPYGGGHFTSHPIGLVIVIGFIVMALVAIPEARWFLAASVILGAALGLILWLLHRSKGFSD
jgi:hypothetical protein